MVRLFIDASCCGVKAELHIVRACWQMSCITFSGGWHESDDMYVQVHICMLRSLQCPLSLECNINRGLFNLFLIYQSFSKWLSTFLLNLKSCPYTWHVTFIYIKQICIYVWPIILFYVNGVLVYRYLSWPCWMNWFSFRCCFFWGESKFKQNCLKLLLTNP